MKTAVYYKYSQLAKVSSTIRTYEADQLNKLDIPKDIVIIDNLSTGRESYCKLVDLIQSKEVNEVVVHSWDTNSIDLFKKLQQLPDFDFKLTIINFFTDKETSSLTCEEVADLAIRTVDARCMSKGKTQEYFKLSKKAMPKVLDNQLHKMAVVTVVKVCMALNICPFRLENGAILETKTKLGVKEKEVY